MINVDISKSDMMRIKRKLDSITPAKRPQTWAQALREGGQIILLNLKRNISGKYLNSPTGALKRSINVLVTKEAGQSVALIGSGVGIGKRLPYANIHETGGTIRPKHAKKLAIPTRFVKTKTGAGRGNKPRDYKNTFIKRTKKGGLYIFQKKGKGKGIIPLYKLVDEVKIKATKYMSKTAKQSSKAVVRKMLAVINMQLKKVG